MKKKGERWRSPDVEAMFHRLEIQVDGANNLVTVTYVVYSKSAKVFGGSRVHSSISEHGEGGSSLEHESTDKKFLLLHVDWSKGSRGDDPTVQLQGTE